MFGNCKYVELQKNYRIYSVDCVHGKQSARIVCVCVCFIYGSFLPFQAYHLLVFKKNLTPWKNLSLGTTLFHPASVSYFSSLF